MNALFTKNLTYLEKNYPNVYLRVNNNEVTQRIEVFESKNQELNVRLLDDGQEISLYSRYSPTNEIEAVVRNCTMVEKDTVVMLGYGLGYLLNRISELYPEKNKIVIEPDLALFQQVLEYIDIEIVLKRKNISLIVGLTPEEIHQELASLYQQGKIYNISFLTTPTYGRRYKALWERVQEDFLKYLRVFNMNMRTTHHFKDIWLRNMFSNLEHLSQSADIMDFENQFKDVPAILVSAGPSLNKQLDLLKTVEDKALIVCAGSTVSVLLKAGIKPHIMVGIDGAPQMSEVFNQVQWRDVLFAYNIHLHYDSLDNFRMRPKLYLKSMVDNVLQYVENELGHHTTTLISGASCANIALDMIKKLGCNPVIFIGQDLAYTNMQSHASGRDNSHSLEEARQKIKDLLITRDIYQNEIYTSQSLQSMAYGFEGYIEKQPETDLFLNATEGGIPIRGARNISFKEAVDKYCEGDKGIRTRVLALCKSGTSNNEFISKSIRELLAKLVKENLLMEKLSKERLKMIDSILKTNNSSSTVRINKKKDRIFKVTKKLEATDIFKHVIGPITREKLMVLKNIYEIRAQHEKDLTTRLQILYTGLQKQYEEIEMKRIAFTFALEEGMKRVKGEVELGADTVEG